MTTWIESWHQSELHAELYQCVCAISIVASNGASLPSAWQFPSIRWEHFVAAGRNALSSRPDLTADSSQHRRRNWRAMYFASGPRTAVRLSSYRLVYVNGDVSKPGEYPYRPPCDTRIFLTYRKVSSSNAPSATGQTDVIELIRCGSAGGDEGLLQQGKGQQRTSCRSPCISGASGRRGWSRILRQRGTASALAAKACEESS